MNTSNAAYQDSGTIAATFANRDAAKTALHDLHDAGFRNVWLGVTHSDGAAMTVDADDGGSVMGSLGRFFSGEGAEEQTLHHALVAHGVDLDQARRIEATITPGGAIVTAGGENDAAEALQILELHGGIVAGDASTATSSIATGTIAAGTVAAVSEADATRRLQLREERLLIDKQRIASGEARIRKEVVSEQQAIDVPVYHEVLFVQRRPVVDGATSSTTPIGVDEEIRVPLSEERVDVSKRTVVTEEVEVGTRKVEGVEHVSDTVRHEELIVEDGIVRNESKLRGA